MCNYKKIIDRLNLLSLELAIAEYVNDIVKINDLLNTKKTLESMI